MPQKQTRGCRKTRNEKNPPPTPPPIPKNQLRQANVLAAITRAKYTKLQIDLLEKAQQPIDFPFNPTTKEDLRKLQVELLHRHYNREISANDFLMGSQTVVNLTRIMESTEIEDRLNELAEQAQAARKVIADRIGMEANSGANQPTPTTPIPRPSKMDGNTPNPER